MSDVFLSYARADQARIESLAKALEELGHSVWWDRNIEGGSHFAKDIEREIRAARAVVVAWSAHSIESHWVLDEAGYARDEGKIVPITLDGTQQPFGFRQVQALDFSEWPASRSGLAGLERAVARLIGEAPHELVEAPAAAPGKRSNKRALVLGGTVAAALLVAGGTYVAMNGTTAETVEVASEPVALAILPFSVSGDAGDGDNALTNGFSGALNTNLSGLAGLALVSNTSTTQLAEEGLSIAAIGERLGVDYLVEGSMQFSGSEVVLDIALIEARSSRQLWNERFREDRGFLDVLMLRTSNALASMLQSRFGVGQGSTIAHVDANPRAYEAYLRGMELLLSRQFGDNRRSAFAQFQRAVQIDPDFAAAQAALGLTLALGDPAAFSLSPSEGEALATASIDNALERDPGNLMAQVARELMPTTFGGDVGAAIVNLQELTQDHPDYALGQYALGLNLTAVGESEAALQHYREALRIDPVDTSYNNFYTLSLVLAGNYDEVRSAAMECTDCFLVNDVWYGGLMWLADDEQYRSDASLWRERWTTILPEEERFLPSLVLPAYRENRPLPVTAAELGVNDVAPVILAAFGQYEDALSVLGQQGEEYRGLDQTARLLDSPSPDWPEEVRADPRYHAVFDDPVSQSILEERRKRGNLHSFPVFPVRPYEGP